MTTSLPKICVYPPRHSALTWTSWQAISSVINTVGQHCWSSIQILFVALLAHAKAHSYCRHWTELNWQFIVLK